MSEKKSGNPHINHRERMRNRFAKEGSFQNFDDHQIVEMLLFYVFRQGDTNLTAHRLIDRFGSIPGILNASIEEIASVEGCGPNTAIFFRMLLELIKLYYNAEATERSVVMDRCEILGEYFVRKFLGCQEEMVYLLLLDNGLHELGCEVIGVGNLTSVNLDMRKAVDAAFRYHAVHVVLAHNHLSAGPNPSNDDVIATTFFQNTMQQLEINVLDHIIVSGKNYTSLKQLEYL